MKKIIFSIIAVSSCYQNILKAMDKSSHSSPKPFDLQASTRCSGPNSHKKDAEYYTKSPKASNAYHDHFENAPNDRSARKSYE